jgi:hypothetical protein
MRSLALLAGLLACASASADTYGIRQVGAAWEFTVDGQPTLTYHVPPDAAKPFIDPLRTPAGHSVTTNRSGQPHHHGLWLTWGPLIAGDRGETVNFWAEPNDPATGEIVLRPTRHASAEVYADGASLVTRDIWRRRSDGLELLREKREVRLLDSGSRRARLLTIVSEQRAVRYVTISHQSNEKVSYYGLCVQMPPEMYNGLVVSSKGGKGRSGVEGMGADWCAYATDVAPARGIAIFDHPDNPRHPNAWFTLDSGFLSTSLVAHDDYSLKPGERLRLCYGVLVFDGDFDRSFVGRQYKRWLAASTPSP